MLEKFKEKKLSAGQYVREGAFVPKQISAEVRQILAQSERQKAEKEAEKLRILTERVKKVLLMDKNAILKGKKLADYVSEEIA